DGDNNSGRDVPAARDEAVAKGITINGLVILSQTQMSSNSAHANEHTNPPGGLANYYRDNVIGGPGAFVVVAENFNSFGDAIIKKLIAEIAQAVPQRRASTPAERTCLWGMHERTNPSCCALNGASSHERRPRVASSSRAASVSLPAPSELFYTDAGK